MTRPALPTHDAPTHDAPQNASENASENASGGAANAQPSRATLADLLNVELFAANLPASGRLMGIDGGTKTFGLALSDPSRTIATGLETVRRKKFATDADRLFALVDEHDVCALVIGYPLNLDGSEGPRAQATRALQRNLHNRRAMPMLLWDERLTTQAAERALLEADQSRAKRATVIDMLAATLILQGALERLAQAKP